MGHHLPDFWGDISAIFWEIVCESWAIIFQILKKYLPGIKDSSQMFEEMFPTSGELLAVFFGNYFPNSGELFSKFRGIIFQFVSQKNISKFGH